MPCFARNDKYSISIKWILNIWRRCLQHKTIKFININWIQYIIYMGYSHSSLLPPPMPQIKFCIRNCSSFNRDRIPVDDHNITDHLLILVFNYVVRSKEKTQISFKSVSKHFQSISELIDWGRLNYSICRNHNYIICRNHNMKKNEVFYVTKNIQNFFTTMIITFWNVCKAYDSLH